MAETLAVVVYQLAQVCQVVNHMDASTPIQLGRFEQPEVESAKVAQRHGEFEDVLLE